MGTYQFSNQTGFYKGKVRDVYTIDHDKLVMIASDRISAFDVILPSTIPYKGQVLNQIACRMLKATEDICPNWLVSSPAPHVSIGKKCTPIKIELVVRGTLTGHAWRTYQSGKRVLCGADMAESLKEHDFFPTPIITPSTKADAGHDEDISPSEILASGIVTQAEWDALTQYALALYERGSAMAKKQGLILADTKYEFGKIGDEIVLMDEIHTPDSSRYFFLDGFEERQSNGSAQPQLSKEFVREWLIANGFMGKPGQTIPDMSDDWINQISRRYIELYERLIGESFKPQTLSDDETFNAVELALKQLS